MKPGRPLFATIFCFVCGLFFAHSACAEPDQPESDATAFFGQAPRDQPSPDKSRYTLIDPVPDDALREFSTDRPGKTHSSKTVDAGHIQIESDLINYTYDRNSPNNQTTRSYFIGAPLFKLGLTNWADLELGMSWYNHVRLTDQQSKEIKAGSGFGDILLGSKINLFGNDDGRQSLAILPFVKFPTAPQAVGNGVTEFTINAPYGIDLDDLWSLTLEPQLGFLKNSENNGLHGDYAFLVNLSRPVFVKDLTAAIEVAADYSNDREITPRYTLDPSLQWVFAPNMQIDVSIYLGLNKAAPDYNPYLGLSYRY